MKTLNVSDYFFDRKSQNLLQPIAILISDKYSFIKRKNRSKAKYKIIDIMLDLSAEIL